MKKIRKVKAPPAPPTLTFTAELSVDGRATSHTQVLRGIAAMRQGFKNAMRALDKLERIYARTKVFERPVRRTGKIDAYFEKPRHRRKVSK